MEIMHDKFIRSLHENKFEYMVIYFSITKYSLLLIENNRVLHSNQKSLLVSRSCSPFK